MGTRFPFMSNRFKKVHLGFEKKCLFIPQSKSFFARFLIVVCFCLWFWIFEQKNVFDRIIMVGLHRKIFEIKVDIRIVYIYASYRDSQVFQSFISIWRIDNIWRTDNTNNLVREWCPVHGKSVVPVRWRVSKIVLLYGAMVLRV